MTAIAHMPAIQPWALTTLLVLGAGAALIALSALAAVFFGFLIAPRLGRPLVYGGLVGVVESIMRWPLRWVHRARLVGFDTQPLPAGGFIVVANHNSGLDAPLMQFAMGRKVRFMMAADQMHPAMSGLWQQLNVLPVHYGPQDSGMLRQATRHVKEGGIVGLFPERGIAKKPHTIDPFAEGVGVLVALTKAPVVLCWSHGARTMGNALLDPLVPRSRANFELVGVYDFASEGVRDPAEICARLRQALAAKSGWPLAETP
jgi:1-acyl-sn-glycerol-3-phosphate acyltransferase